MKIAILGGGVTSLTAAHYLNQKKHNITIYEKESILGGLASGFRGDKWDWPLERAYHHIFSNDIDILEFAEEVGFEEFYFQEPATVSLYPLKEEKGQINYRIIPVDTPQDFLKFPLLSIPEKLRTAFVLAFLKLSPPLSLYEKLTAEEFIRKTMGHRVWEIFWQELFRKKFGKYAGKILTSFIWARIKKRTKSLGYPTGGFQSFIDFVEKQETRGGVIIKKQVGVEAVVKEGGGFKIYQKTNGQTTGELFDRVISTLPTPVFIRVAKDVLPGKYQEQLARIKYLNAVSLILETEKPVFNREYWVNVCDSVAPMMVLVQHTNFIDKKHYNNKHILYVGNYVDGTSPLLRMEKKEVLAHHLSYLQGLSQNISSLSGSYLFKAPFAQPIFDKTFLNCKPTFETPVKGLYVANLDMTYPYDRGTNYAVRLGKEVAGLVI